MVAQFYDWLLDIPRVVAEFGTWLVNPLYPPYINISPLAMLGIGGVSVIIAIIGLHIVRLFVG